MEEDLPACPSLPAVRISASAIIVHGKQRDRRPLLERNGNCLIGHFHRLFRLTFYPELLDAPLHPGGLEPEREADEEDDAEEEDLPGMPLHEVAEGEEVRLQLGAQPQPRLVPGGLVLQEEKEETCIVVR